MYTLKQSNFSFKLPFVTSVVGVDVGGWPMSRGGHQMCLDHTSQTIYLHGGWDGTKNLADFWNYDIEGGVWTCLCQDTSLAVSVRQCTWPCSWPSVMDLRRRDSLPSKGHLLCTDLCISSLPIMDNFFKWLYTPGIYSLYSPNGIAVSFSG